MKKRRRMIAGLHRDGNEYSWRVLTGPRMGKYTTDNDGRGLWRIGAYSVIQERGYADWGLTGLTMSGVRAKIRREFTESEVEA